LINLLSQKDGKVALDAYKNIFEKQTFGTTEALIRFLSDAPSFLRVDNADFQKAYSDLALIAGDDMIARGPQDVRRLETYGTYLLQKDDNLKSIEILEKARTLAPNRQNNLYALGFAYVNNGDITKAVEVFRHAYEVLPENPKAKTYYGAILLLSGDKAGRLLLEGYSYKDPIFLSVFSKSKDYKEIIKIREQLRLDNPADYQNQVSLAVAYVLDGQKTKAVEILRAVQKAVPEFKGQGDYLIREILAGRNILK
jgi:tetratricopeptide (TPR) repeat protein